MKVCWKRWGVRSFIRRPRRASPPTPVMKESARIALTWIQSHAGALGIDERTFDGREFHVHVPAGAIPKDGPSAGVTMVAALASLMTGRPVRSTVGMTGEVTLQGHVLPIGGLKQKVLAAHAAGLTEVILPRRNEADLDEVPPDVRSQNAIPSGGVGGRDARALVGAGRAPDGGLISSTRGEYETDGGLLRPPHTHRRIVMHQPARGTPVQTM